MQTYIIRIATALLLAAPFLSPSAQAQAADKLKAKVRLGTAAQKVDKSPIMAILPVSDRTILVARSARDTDGIQAYKDQAAVLELYDRAKLNLLRTQEIALRNVKQQLFLEAVVLLGGRPVVIASRRDTLVGAIELFWQKIDPNLTNPARPFEQLCVFDAKVYGDGTKVPDGSGHRNVFKTSYSPDGRQVVLYSAAVANLKGDKYRPMVVLGPDAKVVWKQTLELEGDEQLQTVQLDDAANVYMADRIGRSLKDVKNDTTSYQVVLQRVDATGVSSVDHGLGKERFLKSVAFAPSAKGGLRIAGTYTGLDGKGELTMGDMLGLLPPGANKVEQMVTKVFKQNADDAAPTKKAWRMRDVIERKDGGVFLVREYFQETDAVDAKTSMAGLRWIHGPLVVSSWDAKGGELWTSTFRRLLYTKDPHVGEVRCVEHDGQLLLFLIDSEEQMEKRKKADAVLTYLDLKSPFSTMVQFDATGTQKTKAVLRSSGANDYLVGRELWRAGPAEYYVAGGTKLSGENTMPVRIDISVE